MVDMKNLCDTPISGAVQIYACRRTLRKPAAEVPSYCEHNIVCVDIDKSVSQWFNIKLCRYKKNYQVSICLSELEKSFSIEFERHIKVYYMLDDDLICVLFFLVPIIWWQNITKRSTQNVISNGGSQAKSPNYVQH